MHFTSSDTLWPLSISGVFRTALLEWSDSSSYTIRNFDNNKNIVNFARRLFLGWHSVPTYPGVQCHFCVSLDLFHTILVQINFAWQYDDYTEYDDNVNSVSPLLHRGGGVTQAGGSWGSCTALMGNVSVSSSTSPFSSISPSVHVVPIDWMPVYTLWPSLKFSHIWRIIIAVASPNKETLSCNCFSLYVGVL